MYHIVDSLSCAFIFPSSVVLNILFSGVRPHFLKLDTPLILCLATNRSLEQCPIFLLEHPKEQLPRVS